MTCWVCNYPPCSDHPQITTDWEIFSTNRKKVRRWNGPPAPQSHLVRGGCRRGSCVWVYRGYRVGWDGVVWGEGQSIIDMEFKVYLLSDAARVSVPVVVWLFALQPESAAAKSPYHLTWTSRALCLGGGFTSDLTIIMISMMMDTSFTAIHTHHSQPYIHHSQPYIHTIHSHTYTPFTAIHTHHSQPYIHTIHSHTYTPFTAIHTHHSQPYIHTIHSHTYTPFTAIHTHHSQPYIHIIHSHTYTPFTAIHTHHSQPYIHTIHSHTYTPFTAIHTQHSPPYIHTIHSHTYIHVHPIHNYKFAGIHAHHSQPLHTHHSQP